MFKFRCRVLCASAFLLGPALRAEHVLPAPGFAPGSGIEMKITNFYENIPPRGFLPLRVEVKNDSDAARTWQFQSTHSQSGFGSVRSVYALRVDAKSARTFDLLVPLQPESAGGSRYSNLYISISGYATAKAESREHSAGGGSSPTDFLGMGEALSVKNWGLLRGKLEEKKTVWLDGTALDPDLLPTDWRGLAGFEVIIFSDAEWRRIPPAQRNALQDWIVQGGRLILCHAGATAPADLPAAGMSGCGSITHWPLGDDFLERVQAILSGNTSDKAWRNYTWQWKLAQDVGLPEPPQTLMMIFVLVLAVVIGPLNFLVFAPLGKRHRLFWTTPVISLASSALMGIFIVLSEGFGGSGQRFAVQLSLPDLHKSVLWQEQASRTGVLRSGVFVLKESALLIPVGLRLAATGNIASSERGKSYSLDGAIWSGDWFRSRATQAQVLTTVGAARTRLNITMDAGGNPAAVSSFENELKDLWFFDATGKPWRAADVQPGEKRVLEPATLEAFTTWWTAMLEPAGGVARDRAEKFFANEVGGKFFASCENPGFLSSLPSIHWKNKASLLLGLPAQ